MDIPNQPLAVRKILNDENTLNVEWRWVDDKGRAMTNWKLGNVPPIFELKDEKGFMYVEFRDAEK